jgi:hypothetical protein
MPNDISARSDLSRFTDDGPPIAGEPQAFNPPQPRTTLDDDLSDTHFALAFDTGGEG